VCGVCVGPSKAAATAARSDSGGRGGNSSGIIPVSAASTIASESRLVCERVVREAREGPGASPSGSAEGSVGGVDAGGCSGGDSSVVESNTWLTVERAIPNDVQHEKGKKKKGGRYEAVTRQARKVTYILLRELRNIISIRWNAETKQHTMLLLPPAGGPVRTIWSFGDSCVEETFLSLADPPVLQAVQKHFRRTHPADPVARGIEAGFGAGLYVMYIQKQV